MKKIIILLILTLILGCKKETPKPKEQQTTTQKQIILTGKGSVVFYGGTNSDNDYGKDSIFVDDKFIGRITMIPSNAPNCETIGWGVHFTDSVGAHSYKAKITNCLHNYNNYTKYGTFTLSEKSCEAIKISQ